MSMSLKASCVLLWLASACSDSTRSEQAPPGEEFIDVVVLSRSTVDGVTESHKLMRRSELDGDYYIGDGLGFNLTISLRSDSSFDALGSGCVGTYSACYGTWTLDRYGVVLWATRWESIREGDAIPSPLRIVIQEERVVALICPELVDSFGKLGLQRDTALRRQTGQASAKNEGMAKVMEDLRHMAERIKELGY